MVVVPDGDRALGREIRSAVRADGGHEAEPLLLDRPTHLFGQDTHYLLPSRRRRPLYRVSSERTTVYCTRARRSTSDLDDGEGGRGCDVLPRLENQRCVDHGPALRSASDRNLATSAGNRAYFASHPTPEPWGLSDGRVRLGVPADPSHPPDRS